MKKRILISLAMAGACTSFVKVDDAGAPDAERFDAEQFDASPLDDARSDAAPLSDAGFDAGVDAGPPPCGPESRLEHTGTLDPEFGAGD